jgi:hypothetical protein
MAESISNNVTVLNRWTAKGQITVKHLFTDARTSVSDWELFSRRNNMIDATELRLSKGRSQFLTSWWWSDSKTSAKRLQYWTSRTAEFFLY